MLIEWLMNPLPDLTWIPLDDAELKQQADSDERFREKPEVAESFRRMRRVSNFWDSATLGDDLATTYESGWADSGSQDGGAYKGHIAFSPAPPIAAVQLTLRVQDLAVTIALRPG